MIFEAIAVGKVAIEALQTVRSLLEEGKGIAEAGKDLSTFFDSKAKLEEQLKANEENGKSDTELFFELENIKQEEKRFREQMLYLGRPNLLEDFDRFVATRKQLRENAKKAEERKRMARRKAIKNGLLITGVVVGVLTAVGAIGFMVYWMVSVKGR